MFTQAGAEVVGVSNDQPEALIEFAKSQRLNFPLLSDEGGKLRKGLKVKGAAGASLSNTECKYAQMGLFCFHCHAKLSSCHKRYETSSNCSQCKAEGKSGCAGYQCYQHAVVQHGSVCDH